MLKLSTESILCTLLQMCLLRSHASTSLICLSVWQRLEGLTRVFASIFAVGVRVRSRHHGAKSQEDSIDQHADCGRGWGGVAPVLEADRICPPASSAGFASSSGCPQSGVRTHCRRLNSITGATDVNCYVLRTYASSTIFRSTPCSSPCMEDMPRAISKPSLRFLAACIAVPAPMQTDAVLESGSKTCWLLVLEAAADAAYAPMCSVHTPYSV